MSDITQLTPESKGEPWSGLEAEGGAYQAAFAVQRTGGSSASTRCVRGKENPFSGNRRRKTDLIDRATNPLVVGKQILVPLTSSLYVPGKMSDVESVIVDVGTGYYVKKVGPHSFAILTLTPVLDEERGDRALRRKDDLRAGKLGKAAKDNRDKAE
jgi:hypothetical protein